MAGLFEKQADLYLEGRPDYPKEWYSMLAHRTLHHSLAWDVGTGNGQAAIAVAEHYDEVIATDVSEAQIQRAIQHPRVKYIHTRPALSADDLVSLVGSENRVDLITVAQAVHWFDLPTFYLASTRLLRKPGGIIAVWGYNDVEVSPDFDRVFSRFHETTLPHWDPRIQYIFNGYKTLPFPFEEVGLGSEGAPLELEIPKTVSFEGFLGMVKSWSAIVTAKEKGVELLSEEVVKELENAWGGSNLVRSVVYKAFMLVGRVKV